MVTITEDGVSQGGVSTSSGKTVVLAGGTYVFGINGYYTVSSFGADTWEISDDGASWYGLVVIPAMLFMISGKVRVHNGDINPHTYAWIGYNPIG